MSRTVRALLLVATVLMSVAASYGGVEFPQGEASFVDAVASYDPAINAAGEPAAVHREPTNAIGPPDCPGDAHSGTEGCFVSLGSGGSITVEFVDNALTGSGDEGDDLWIFEVGPDVEDTFVELSEHGTSWIAVGKVGGSISGVDIDAFGFGPADHFSFVRLTDDATEGDQGGVSVGADIDAVGAISTDTAPVLADDAYATDEDAPLHVPAPGVLANDEDADGDQLTAELATGPAHGTVTLAADGEFSYVPASDFNGDDGFAYRVCDVQFGCQVASVTIAVASVNDSPVALDDEYTASRGEPLHGQSVLVNDVDVDGDPLTATLLSGPAHGSIEFRADGTFAYTSEWDYTGPDSFAYEVCDGSGACANATASIDVEQRIASTCADLVAGQHAVVGTVCVDSDGSTATVTYTTDTAWRLDRTHLHIADEVDGIPARANGNPVPGAFDHQGSHVLANVVTYTVELPDSPDGSFVVAAHADVSSVGSRETAWADGERFTERGNWATYIQFVS